MNNSQETSDLPCPSLDGPLQPTLPTQIVVITGFVIVFLLGLGGNGLTCAVILRSSKEISVTRIFLANLAVADMFTVVVCAPFNIVSDILLLWWPFGTVACHVVPFTQAAAVFLTAGTHLLISMDRFLVVYCPLKMRMSRRRAFRILLYVWAVAFFVSSPIAVVMTLGSGGDSSENETEVNKPQCRESWPWPAARNAYDLMVVLLQYFLPLAVISLSYAAILCKLYQREKNSTAASSLRRMATQTPHTHQNAESVIASTGRLVGATGTILECQPRHDPLVRGKAKILKMVIVVASVYAISQIPRHLLQIIGHHDPCFWYLQRNIDLSAFSHLSSISVACLNPLIYCWMNSAFRNDFKTLLSRLCVCCGDTTCWNMRDVSSSPCVQHQHQWQKGTIRSNTCRNLPKKLQATASVTLYSYRETRERGSLEGLQENSKEVHSC